MASLGKQQEPVIDTTPLTGTVSDILPADLHLVRDKAEEDLWDYLIRKYHYLGCKSMPGGQLKYLAYAQGRPIAAIGWKRASLYLEARDAYIGWDNKQRSEHLCQVANNSRFLIVPWVSVRNLGSYLLSRMCTILSKDWQARYRCELVLLETFVDHERFDGTIYKAANWVYVGETKGFARFKGRLKYHGNRKAVYVYLLDDGFREKMASKPPAPPRRHDYAWEAVKKVILNHEWDEHLLDEFGLGEQESDWFVERLVD